jgi:transposase InsO family protein
MLDVIDRIREKTDMPYQAICSAVRVPYPSFMRWRMRRTREAPLVRQPGPQKTGTPDFSRLAQDIMRMNHGTTRTQGTGALYARYALSVSRRELQRLVEMARHDLNVYHRQNLRRIRWNEPNVAWAIDPCEYERCDYGGRKVYLTQLQDMASRYKFNPMAGECPCGEEIAGHLAENVNRFGAPLFLKRDNAGNLNHPSINELLAEHFIIPVNSPVHYPPYNGAIEEAQTELKNGLAEKLMPRPACPREHVEAYAAAVEHDLNHRLRPCLNGRNACQVYFAGRKTFTKWERREAYDWIMNLRNDILSCDDEVQPQAAWRIAVEAWLSMKGFITITFNQKVSPHFLRFLYH